MQIVIDISEKMYEDCKARNTLHYSPYDFSSMIVNGTPLPKGHGRLIDENTLLKYGACPNSCDSTIACTESYKHLHCPIRVFDIESINDTPTIIEADKEE